MTPKIRKMYIREDLIPKDSPLIVCHVQGSKLNDTPIVLMSKERYMEEMREAYWAGRHRETWMRDPYYTETTFTMMEYLELKEKEIEG